MAINARNQHVRFAFAGCDYFGKIVDRNMEPSAAPPQHIDYFMTCDGPNPGAEWCFLIPTLPFEVNGEQCFLHNILGILNGQSGSSQAAARQAAKDRGQLQQQFPVSLGVAQIGRAHEQGPLVVLAVGAHQVPLVLFGPCGPCVTCRVWPCYHVFVIGNMRGRRNARVRANVVEGVETLCRVYPLGKAAN